MALDTKNFQKIAELGVVGTGSGSVKCMHGYASNDDAAAVEGTNYWLGLQPRLSVGDLILCSLDLDGTPAGKLYQVTTSSLTSVVIASVMDAPD